MKMDNQKIKLIPRTDVPKEDIWYRAESPSGREYSVVDIGALMQPLFNMRPDVYQFMFMGWEAMEFVDGELDYDSAIRGKNWAELEELILEHEEERS